ncbi:MAG: AMP-binding protein [Rhizobiaceae bacterium]
MSFVDAFAAYGERPALLFAGAAAISYAELNRRVCRLAGELGPAKRLIALEAEKSEQAIVSYLAALKGGHAVALLPPGCGQALEAFDADFAPDIVFRRADGRWRRIDAAHGLKDDLHPDLAVLLATSGSTGKSRFVRLSGSAIEANAGSIGAYLGLGQDDRAALILPFHYSYGLSVLNSHLAKGASVYVGGKSAADAGFAQEMREAGCTNISGVPYSYELMEKTGFLKEDLPGLRFMTVAGGRIGPELAETFRRRLAARNQQFFVMYGQTEATARIAYVPPESLAGNTDSIGIAIPGGNLRLIDEAGEAVAQAGEAGELAYRGPNVMMGYAECRADLARGHEVEELRTGDIATCDEHGFFRIVGRAKRISKIAGLRINHEAVEAALARQGIAATVLGDDERLRVAFTASDSFADRHPSISKGSALRCPPLSCRTARPEPRVSARPSDSPQGGRLAGRFDFANHQHRKAGAEAGAADLPPCGESEGRAETCGSGQRVRQDRGEQRRARARTHLASATEEQLVLQATMAATALSALQIDVMQVDTLPRLASGKVDFSALRARFDQPVEAKPKESDHDVAGAFRRAFYPRAVGPQDSFETLGGDSLVYVQLSLSLERALGHLPQGWEKMPVSALAKARRVDSARRMIGSDLVLRAGAILTIVIHHATLWPIPGGAATLMMLVGFGLARFQSRALFAGDFSRLLFGLATNLAVYAPIVIGFCLARGEVLWPSVFLAGNLGFVGPDKMLPYLYWFVEAYAQLLLLVTALFALPAVRATVKAKPFACALGFLGMTAMLKVVTPYVWNIGGPQIFTLPDVLYLAVLGWCAHFADDGRKRLVLIAVSAIMLPFMAYWGGNWTGSWVKFSMVLASVAILLYAPRVAVPAWLARLVLPIAAASYHIYLFHRILPEIFLPQPDVALSQPVAATVAVVSGVAIGLAVHALQGKAVAWLMERRVASQAALSPAE